MKLNDYPVHDPKFVAANLQQKMAYQFRVSAVNKAGRSKPSDATAPVTPRDPDGRALLTDMMSYPYI